MLGATKSHHTVVNLVFGRLLGGRGDPRCLVFFEISMICKIAQINGFPMGIASQKERFLKTFLDFCPGEIPATGFEATTKFCCSIENVL